ncbi:MAG: DNA mismatch repair endonuclease MutL, partial [Oscillospiraceae bacterium]|nr:DNA mismatch repair endonuclease MutL [Oscillospiraceae bacterium]
LEAIGTLGFRGEALAAIAAVARVELLTRRQEDALGTSLAIEGGELLGKEEAGCPLGTTMLVRDLFYNTPARLKFMKKDAAEGAACLAVVQRQALAHPEVSFKFLRDGKQELLTPGDGSLKSAMYAVLGRDLALGFVPVEGSGEDISVSGFVSLPTCCRGTRGTQFFFVNGRYIKSQTMTAALEQAYANQKMVGKFPGCVLHITVKLNQVDVNVHPTKQEVKFGAERAVFSAVYYAVLGALGADKTRPTVQTEALKPKIEQGVQTSLPLHDFTHSARPVEKKPTETAKPPVYETHPVERPTAPVWSPDSRKAEAPVTPEIPASEVQEEKGAPGKTEGFVGERRSSEMTEPSGVPGGKGYGACDDEEEPQQEEPWRIVGELFHTYVIVEQGEKAFLIDKHAAHERVNFDKMRAVDYTPMSQT